MKSADWSVNQWRSVNQMMTLPEKVPIHLQKCGFVKESTDKRDS